MSETNFTCPLCRREYSNSKSLKLHHNHCSIKQYKSTVSNNTELQESILAEDDQIITILDNSSNHLTSEERSYKRKRHGYDELNAQFASVQSTTTEWKLNTASEEELNIQPSSSDNLEGVDSSLSTTSSDNCTNAEEGNEQDNDNNTSKQSRLLMQNKEYLKNLPKGYSIDYLVGFNLMDILDKANSPLYLYDEIMKWATVSFNDHQFRFPKESASSSRCKIKDFAFKSTSSNNLHPKAEYINIGPNKNIPVEVVKFDTIGMIHSLLSDPELMKDENLLFDGEDPFPIFNDKGELPNPTLLKDINSGIWYKRACETLCEHEIDIVCPILMFIDGLTIDEYSNIQLEPVTFTLGIFKRAVRNLEQAWRTLGYINNVNEYDTYKVFENEDNSEENESNNENNNRNHNHNITSLDKIEDYHTILNQILSDLREIQDSGGLLWDLPYKGKTHRVRFKFPIQFIIGDCKGHNLLCGRYGSNNSNSLCRDCDVLLVNGGDPSVQCKRITQEKIETLIQENKEDDLHKLSFHNMKNNCFHTLCFSGDPYGVYGATLPELLHVLRITLTGHIITEFKTRSKNSELELLHTLSSKIGNYGYRQSDREYYKIKFSRHITNIARLSGDDKMGAMFLMFLSMFTTCGLMNFSKNESRLKLILPAIEYLLIFHEWAMSEEHNINDLYEEEIEDIDIIDQADFNLNNKSPAYRAIKRLMVIYKNGVQRSDGNGFNFPKFHQLLHTVMNIIRHGSMRNWDGARLEGIGKTTGKQPCRRTQRNTKTLLKQTGERYVERLVFKRCSLRVLTHYNLRINKEGKQKEERDYLKGSRYKVFMDKNVNPGELTFCWCSEKVVVIDNGITVNAAFYAYNYLKIGRVDSSLSIDELIFRTEYIDHNGNIFRSHPSFRTDGQWHDWVMLKWESTSSNSTEFDIVPARIFGFFEIKQKDITHCSNTCAGKWMIVSSLCYDPVSIFESLPNQNGYDRAYMDSFNIAKKWRIDYDEEGIHKFWIVNVDNIHDTAYVVPDIDEKKQLSKEFVIVVNKRSNWKDHFIKQTDRRIGRI